MPDPRAATEAARLEEHAEGLGHLPGVPVHDRHGSSGCTRSPASGKTSSELYLGTVVSLLEDLFQDLAMEDTLARAYA